MSDLSVSQNKYADARMTLSSAKQNVDSITKALESAKSQSLWQMQKEGSCDSSNVDKLNDQLSAAKSQYDLADMWDTHKNTDLLSAQLRAGVDISA